MINNIYRSSKLWVARCDMLVFIRVKIGSPIEKKLYSIQKLKHA